MQADDRKHLGRGSVEAEDRAGVVSTSHHDSNLVLSVEMEKGDARAFGKGTEHQRLLHVTQIPSTPLSLHLLIESSCENSLSVDPVHADLARSSVRSCLNGCAFLSGVHIGHRFVFANNTDHLAVRTPANRCCKIGDVSKGNHRFFTSILIDIPNLYSFIN